MSWILPFSLWDSWKYCPKQPISAETDWQPPKKGKVIPIDFWAKLGQQRNSVVHWLMWATNLLSLPLCKVCPLAVFGLCVPAAVLPGSHALFASQLCINSQLVLVPSGAKSKLRTSQLFWVQVAWKLGVRVPRANSYYRVIHTISD